VWQVKIETLPKILWIAAFPIFIAVVLIGCKTKEIPSSWADSEITIDGNASDWSEYPGTMFEDQGAVLDIANDSEFLYILFKTRDMRWVRTIRSGGLTFYLNPKDKKSKDHYLLFRGGPSRETMRHFFGDNRGENAQETKRFRPPGFENGKEPEPSLICFLTDMLAEKQVPLDGSEGPAIACDTSGGFFVYEFRIPLALGSVRYNGIGAKPGQTITIGAEWGGFKNSRRDFRPEGRGEFGGTMPPTELPPSEGPGGMGGPGGGFGGNRHQMPEKQEIWFKTELVSGSEDAAALER
jgi:hypothetical protein